MALLLYGTPVVSGGLLCVSLQKEDTYYNVLTVHYIGSEAWKSRTGRHSCYVFRESYGGHFDFL